MKITPIPSVQNVAVPASGAASADIRRLTMNTNATPGVAQLEHLPDAVAPVDDKINSDEAAIEDTKPLSPQYAALAKQKRALQKEREDFEKQKAATSKGTVDAARLKSNLFEVLLEQGMSWDDITLQAQNFNGNSPIHELNAKIKALEEGVDKKLTERDTQQYNQAVAEMRREAETLVKDDAFELVRETRSVPSVIRLIELTFKDTGEILSVQEAMQLVEDKLLEDNLKLANLKKMQSKLAPQPVLPTPPTQRQGGMRTLTNQHTAAAAPLSAKQRALQAFYGQLKR